MMADGENGETHKCNSVVTRSSSFQRSNKEGIPVDKELKETSNDNAGWQWRDQKHQETTLRKLNKTTG